MTGATISLNEAVKKIHREGDPPDLAWRRLWKALQDDRLRTRCALLIGPDGRESQNQAFKPGAWKACCEFGWQESSAQFKFRNGGRWTPRVTYKAFRIAVESEDIENAFPEARQGEVKDKAPPVSRADLRKWYQSLEAQHRGSPPSVHKIWALGKGEFGDRITRQVLLDARPAAWKRRAGRPRK